MSEMAETVGVATSITLSAMSANRLRSMEASVEARTIRTLGREALQKQFTKEGVGVGRCGVAVYVEAAALACGRRALLH